jgi:hypothetical protein
MNLNLGVLSPCEASHPTFFAVPVWQWRPGTPLLMLHSRPWTEFSTGTGNKPYSPGARDTRSTSHINPSRQEHCDKPTSHSTDALEPTTKATQWHVLPTEKTPTQTARNGTIRLKPPSPKYKLNIGARLQSQDKLLLILTNTAHNFSRQATFAHHI